MQQTVSLVDWDQVSSKSPAEVERALQEDRVQMESYLDFYPEWGDSDKLACFLGFALHWVADNGPEDMALQVREGLYPILGQQHQRDELQLSDVTGGVIAVALSPATIATMVAYCRQLDGRALEALLRVKAPKLLEDFDKWEISFLGYLKQWTDVLGIAHERERGLFLFVG
jgi:hypothetical protein